MRLLDDSCKTRLTDANAPLSQNRKCSDENNVGNEALKDISFSDVTREMNALWILDDSIKISHDITNTIDAQKTLGSEALRIATFLACVTFE